MSCNPTSAGRMFGPTHSDRVRSRPLWLSSALCFYFSRIFQTPVLLQLLGVDHFRKSGAYFDNMEAGTHVGTLGKTFKFLSMTRAFPVDSQELPQVFSSSEFVHSSVQVIRLLPLSSAIPCLFLRHCSPLVCAQLGFHILTYFIRQKDTEAAAALVLEEIMEPEST